MFIDALDLAVTAEVGAKVEDEQEIGKPVWRADLVVRWPSKEVSNLELKIAHLMSDNQADAMERGDLHAFVRPADHARDAPYPVPSITWLDVSAACTGHPLLRLVFEEAEHAGSYTLDRLPAATLTNELTSYSTPSSNGGWPSLHGFLHKLHLELKATLGSYDRGGRPSQYRVDGRSAFYGFNFTVGEKGPPFEWWIGFHYSRRGVPVLGLEGDTPIETWHGDLVVADVAIAIKGLTGG